MPIFRLRVRNEINSSMIFAEIRLFTKEGKEITLQNPTLTYNGASSAHNGYGPWRALDGNPETYFQTETKQTEWAASFEIDYLQNVGAVYLLPRVSYTTTNKERYKGVDIYLGGQKIKQIYGFAEKYAYVSRDSRLVFDHDESYTPGKRIADNYPVVYDSKDHALSAGAKVTKQHEGVYVHVMTDSGTRAFLTGSKITYDPTVASKYDIYSGQGIFKPNGKTYSTSLIVPSGSVDKALYYDKDSGTFSLKTLYSYGILTATLVYNIGGFMAIDDMYVQVPETFTSVGDLETVPFSASGPGERGIRHKFRSSVSSFTGLSSSGTDSFGHTKYANYACKTPKPLKSIPADTSEMCSAECDKMLDCSYYSFGNGTCDLSRSCTPIYTPGSELFAVPVDRMITKALEYSQDSQRQIDILASELATTVSELSDATRAIEEVTQRMNSSAVENSGLEQQVIKMKDDIVRANGLLDQKNILLIEKDEIIANNSLSTEEKEQLLGTVIQKINETTSELETTTTSIKNSKDDIRNQAESLTAQLSLLDEVFSIVTSLFEQIIG